MALTQFLPTSIPNLTLWLDASDPTNLFQSGTRGAPGAAVAANNDPVGLWLDLSGQNNDVSTAANKPAWVTSGFTMPAKTGYGFANSGFIPAVAFTGSGVTATPLRSSSAFLTAGYNQAFTIIIVRAGEPGYAPAVYVSDNNAAPHFWGGCGNSTLQRSMGSATQGTLYATAGAQAGDAAVAAIDTFTYDGTIHAISHNGRPLYQGYTGNCGFTGQNITIGGYANAIANGYTGNIGEVLVYNRALTQAEMGQISAYLSSKWQITVPLGTQVLGLGNSLTLAYRAVDARRYPGGDWPAQLKAYYNRLGVDLSVVNAGELGRTTTQMIANARAAGTAPHNDVYSQHKRTLENSICVVWEGSNDLADVTNGVGNAPVSAFANLRDYCLFRKQEGFFVICATILPRNSGTTNFEQNRVDVNQAIRNLYSTSGSQTSLVNGNTYTGAATPFADAILDFGGDPLIGQAFGTSGLWQSDGTHFTPNGYAYIAQLVAAAIYNVAPTVGVRFVNTGGGING